MDPWLILFGFAVGTDLAYAAITALLLTGALVLPRALISNGGGERETVPLQARHKAAAVALGASVGFMLGLTSAGSGTLIAIGLILLGVLAFAVLRIVKPPLIVRTDP